MLPVLTKFFLLLVATGSLPSDSLVPNKSFFILILKPINALRIACGALFRLFEQQRQQRLREDPPKPSYASKQRREALEAARREVAALPEEVLCHRVLSCERP